MYPLKENGFLRNISLFSLKINVASILIAFSCSCHAVERFDFMAEHVPEAIQDARFYSLPWSIKSWQDKRIHAWLSSGYTQIENDIAQVDGYMMTVGLSRRISKNFILAIYTYKDRFNVETATPEIEIGNENQVIKEAFRELPQKFRFLPSTASFDLSGIGVSLVNEHRPLYETIRWRSIVGLTTQRLNLIDYVYRYEILTGPQAGDKGEFDYSGIKRLVIPYAGLELSYPLAENVELLPHFVVGLVLKKDDFDMTLRGSDFELTSKSMDTNQAQIGDDVVVFGATLRHTKYNIQFGLGSVITLPIFEYITHPGFNKVINLNVSWQF